ncbi:replicative DNA helicase [Salmonella enterica subsp. enterica serovar Kokomlemle]
MTPVWRNDDLEGAVIGAMFLRNADPEVLEIISRLPANAFNVSQYRDIYAGICRQVRSNGVIDPLLLCEVMPRYSAIIMESSRIAWAKSSLDYYVSVLLRNATIRDGEAVLMKALEGIRNAGNGELAVVALEEAKNAMTTVGIENNTVQATPVSDLLPVVADRLEASHQGKTETRGLMMGIDELDAITGGIDLTDLVFIAGRPSMGKTELALDIIDKITEQGHGVLFFSMEMSDIQITERMVSAVGGLPVSRLKAANQFSDEDWARVFGGMERLMARKIWIADAANLTVEQICQTANRYCMEHPEIALVVVDYLALIKIKSAARYDLAVGEVSKGLKNLAKANKTPVIALSQLSRGVESRPNKRPMNSDLKNSGEIEADADIIMMLYRDEVYNPDSPAKGIAEINITKQRNGALGTVYRRFYNGHFLPIDQEEAKRLSAPQPKTQSRRYAKGNRTDYADF